MKMIPISNIENPGLSFALFFILGIGETADTDTQTPIHLNSHNRKFLHR